MRVYFLALLSSVKILAVSTGSQKIQEKDPSLLVPWFTGPLLGPSANTVPEGHIVVEPYIYFSAFTGSYNSNWQTVSHPNFYSLVSQTFIMTGVNPYMEFRITPEVFYQSTQGVHSTEIGDLPIAFGWQLLSDTLTGWIPSVKFSLRISYPVGKYQRLDPKKLGTDGVGTGSWAPTISLASSKLFALPKGYFLSLRAYAGYSFANATSINGLSVYGGTFDTKGTIYPGNTFISSVSMELTLSKHWVFSSDIQYIHHNKTKFFGNPGTLANVGSPASEQLSIAPAIEYNWNLNIGVIAGAWLSIAGKSTSCFRSGMAAINLYF